MKYLIILLIFPLLVSNNHAKKKKQKSGVPYEHYKIYKAAMDNHFEKREGYIIVNSSTVYFDKINDYLLGKKGLPGFVENDTSFTSLPKQLIAANKKPSTLTNRFKSHNRTRIIGNKDLKKIFKNKDDAWKLYSKRFPKSISFMSFSKIAVDKTGKHALLYYDSKMITGRAAGYVAMLQKEGEQWKVLNSDHIWHQ